MAKIGGAKGKATGANHLADTGQPGTWTGGKNITPSHAKMKGGLTSNPGGPAANNMLAASSQNGRK